MSGGLDAAVDEVVALTSRLIAFDTTNDGDASRPGRERAAAEFVAAQLSEVGYATTYVESGPGRGNVVARLDGADSTRGALLVHGHLDVVPADASEWSVHPFSGEVTDGYVWGRGAVDMKDMAAMTLAVARAYKREGVVPQRDLVFAFVADEEAGGTLGARWLVDNRPDLFDGVDEAIGEVGGFSVTTTGPDPARVYLVQTAQKGALWLRLAVHGTAGHASMIHEDNAVSRLVRALARLDAHRFPVVLSDSVRQFLHGIGELTGVPFDDSSPESIGTAAARLGNLARLVGATLNDTATPTMLDAGYKANVVPSVARATVDGRMLPGRETAFVEELSAILGPDVKMDWDLLPAVETTFDGHLVDAISRVIAIEDAAAHVLPYMLSAGTDAVSFARLGIRHLGFAPLQLPPSLDFTALFHGVDERVPVEALQFGTRVLYRLLRSC